MILCTSTNLSKEYIERIGQITNEEICFGKIQSLSSKDRETVDVLVALDNDNKALTRDELELLPNLRWVHVLNAETKEIPFFKRIDGLGLFRWS